MEYLLYLIGLIIGFGLFFYLLSLYHSGREKVEKMRSHGTMPPPVPSMKVEPQSIFHKKFGRTPGERICPLCGSILTRNEALYATPVKSETGPKILILGCRYCYSLDESDTT